MARPRKIDREKLLDLAEDLIAKGGTASLTFGSLAEAASLSKASVQTVFVTREAMVESLMARWMARDTDTYQAMLAGDISARARLKAHLQTTQQEEGSVSRAVSAMLATLASSGNVSLVHSWYRMRMDDLEANDLESRKRRLSYLASEGVFLLRNLVGLEVKDDKWAMIFRDIEELLG